MYRNLFKLYFQKIQSGYKEYFSLSEFSKFGDAFAKKTDTCDDSA